MNFINKFYSKFCPWSKTYKRCRLLKSLTCEVILKSWEHNSWGDQIVVMPNGRIRGHLSNLRYSAYPTGKCDLQDGDILIFKNSEDSSSLCGSFKYDVGCLININIQSDPKDMFFADYYRICLCNNINDIPGLINQEIKKCHGTE